MDINKVTLSWVGLSFWLHCNKTKACSALWFVWEGPSKGSRRFLKKNKEAYQGRYIMAAVKHNGGWVMIQVSFAATGLRHFVVNESTMNCEYQSILVHEVIQELRCGWNWVSNKAVIPNTPANRPHNVWKRKELKCCKDSVKVQTSIRLKCCSQKTW